MIFKELEMRVWRVGSVDNRLSKVMICEMEVELPESLRTFEHPL